MIISSEKELVIVKLLFVKGHVIKPVFKDSFLSAKGNKLVDFRKKIGATSCLEEGM